MATERISFLATSDADDCKLGDNVSLWFDGTEWTEVTFITGSDNS